MVFKKYHVWFPQKSTFWSLKKSTLVLEKNVTFVFPHFVLEKDYVCSLIHVWSLKKTFVMSLGCFWKKSKFDSWKNPYLALKNSIFVYLIHVWSLKKISFKKKTETLCSWDAIQNIYVWSLENPLLDPTNSTFGPQKNHLWSIEKYPHLGVSEKNNSLDRLTFLEKVLALLSLNNYLKKQSLVFKENIYKKFNFYGPWKTYSWNTFSTRSPCKNVEKKSLK